MNTEDDKLDRGGAMFPEKTNIGLGGNNKTSGLQGSRIENVNLHANRPTGAPTPRQNAAKKQGICQTKTMGPRVDPTIDDQFIASNISQTFRLGYVLLFRVFNLTYILTTERLKHLTISQFSRSRILHVK